jgi:predicted transposase YbfD/YdcC
VSLRLGEATRHIAIDGKTSRRSGSPTNGQAPIHTVSAYLREAGVVLAQTQVREKSNEITAIPEVLALLDLRNATVTSDAMGCQTEIVETIVKAGGDYLICAKGNQPTLEEEIKETFREASDPRRRAVDEVPRPEVAVHEEIEKAHGRIEQRTVRVTSCLDWIQSADRWAGLGYVVEVRRERTVIATGKTSIETSHFIGSGTPPSAQRAASLIRRHWSIENGLHWVLDVAFREDDARHRAKNAAANMTTLRHFALALVRNDPNRKLGVANTRKKAAFARNYLISLFAGFAR